MPGGGYLALPEFFLLVIVVPAVTFFVRRKWRLAQSRKREIRRLLILASQESARAELEATLQYSYSSPLPPAPVRSPSSSSFSAGNVVSGVPPQQYCAVCYLPTTTRCSRCKAVRYCSDKCQIVHWRQGHKDECCPPTTSIFNKRGAESCSQGNVRLDGLTLRDDNVVKERDCSAEVLSFSVQNISSRGPGSRQNNDAEPLEVFPEKVSAAIDLPTASAPVSYSECSVNTSLSTNDHDIVRGTASCSEFQGVILSKVASQMYERIANEATVAEGSTDDTDLTKDSVNNSALPSGNFTRERTNSVVNSVSNITANLKTSMRKVVHQLKAPKLLKHKPVGHGNENENAAKPSKAIFPYDLFVKLYSDKVELRPFGLANCGNSCYANAVLQCLVFTPPLTSFLLQGLHGKQCKRAEWCFTCEFEKLVLQSREGKLPLSPIRIISQVHSIGSNLGYGKEEDAHEFLRNAIDAMQCPGGVRGTMSGSFIEERTLLQLTFGGYLRSNIKCMKCHVKSVKREPMMDLTVGIDGDIGTLEEALKQFTASETLDDDNKYMCERCTSYVRARKRLTVYEAPNILTIVLKRFQSGKFGKINKPVHFPQELDLRPYMSEPDDAFSAYKLYAVVVHLDVMNASFSGHYICYVKNKHDKWYKIDDSKVKPVEPDRVLSKGGAYMLLYARSSPHLPRLIRNRVYDGYPKSRSSSLDAEVIKRSHSTPRPRAENLSAATVRRGHDAIRSAVCSSDDLQLMRGCRVLVDSGSDNSSLFSCSDEASCSTRDSTSTDDYSNYIFGDSGRHSWGWNSPTNTSEGSGGCSLATAGDHEPQHYHSANSNTKFASGAINYDGLSRIDRRHWSRKGSPLFLYSDHTDVCSKVLDGNSSCNRSTGEVLSNAYSNEERHEMTTRWTRGTFP